MVQLAIAVQLLPNSRTTVGTVLVRTPLLHVCPPATFLPFKTKLNKKKVLPYVRTRIVRVVWFCTKKKEKKRSAEGASSNGAPRIIPRAVPRTHFSCSFLCAHETDKTYISKLPQELLSLHYHAKNVNLERKKKEKKKRPAFQALLLHAPTKPIFISLTPPTQPGKRP